MAGSDTITKDTAKFAGIKVPQELDKNNFIFLYLNTFLADMLMGLPGLLQSAFLKDIISSNYDSPVSWLAMNVN